MGAEICFDGYLRSIVNTHQKWEEWYTPTDATGKNSSQIERDCPAFFDFGLMVQTVEPPKAEQEGESERDREKKEKIERLPVLEGICKYAVEHVLLVGRPGSGKSTALARLLLQEAENALSIAGAKIPVLVELRYLPSDANESSVCDRILAFMHKHDPALDIDEAGIKQLLRQGRLLLLVDGVNELPSDRGRVMVNQFRELYQKTCPMIFTTRELSAGGDLGIAKRLEMQPLSEPQMQQFVMAYLPTQGERLLRQLSGRLREFGQTPLLLWMLCSLFQQSEQIPPNLGMVFRAFTVGYGDRIKQDVTLSKDSRAWWGRLLQYLAFKMTCGESLTELQVAISRREAEQFLVEFLRGKVEFADDCAVRWLEDLLKHHLIQISNDRIEFRHQLIQEYYAAEWLRELLPSLSDARLQQGYLNYLKWTEPLALMLALVESEEQALRVVRLALEVDLQLGARLAGAVKHEFQEKTVGLLIHSIDKWKIPRLKSVQVKLKYALSCWFQFVFLRKTSVINHFKVYKIELLDETKSDFVVELLIQAFKDDDDDVRTSAAEALGNIGSDKAVKSLIHVLKDSDWNVRWNATKVLGNIGSDKAVEPLIHALKDSDRGVRWNVAEALGKIGSDKVVEPLIHALKDVDILRSVVKALGNIGSDKVVESLIHALKNLDRDVHINAAEALGNIGSDKAVEPLIHVLKDSAMAVWALGNIGSDKAVEPLIHVLKDSDKDVRINAAVALGNIGSDKAVEPLIHALKDSDKDVRINAAVALGNIGGDKAVELLIHALKDSDRDVRSNAAEILGKIASDKAVKSLTQALKDEDSNVVRKVSEALVKIGSEKAVKSLTQALKDEDILNDEDSCGGLRFNAIKASFHAVEILVKIDSSKATEFLIRSLKSKNSYVRRKAAYILSNLGNDKAVELLIQDLNDEDYDIGRKAAEALVKIGSEKATEFLIRSLKSKDHYMRSEAAYMLSNFGDDKVIESLIQAFKDEDSHVCDEDFHVYVYRYIALALGNIGTDKAIEPLTQVLNDEDHEVRSRAVLALGNIGSDKAVELLIHALKDEDYEVRRNAVLALSNIGGDKVIEPLIQALNSENIIVGRFAVSSLGKIRNNRAIEALIYALKNKDIQPFVRSSISEELGNIVSKNVIEPLIQVLNDEDFNVRDKAAEAVEKISKADRNLPTLSQQLPHLLTLIPTKSSRQALSVITAIQARCKYYNYDIAQTPLQEENNNDKFLSNPQGKTIHMTEIKNDFSGANFGGANIANLGGTINEQKIVQKTEVPKQSLAEATKEVQDLLNQLAKINPSESTIADTIQQEIKRNPTLKARLVNALKTGGIEALKAIFNNPFVSIPVETIKGFLEAEE